MNLHDGHDQRTRAVRVFGDARTQSLSWTMLTDSEKESFKGGLRARIMSLLSKALQAPTGDEYRRLRDQSAIRYHALVVILLAEESNNQTATSDAIQQALDQVESAFSEDHRHQLEHALNVSDNARAIISNAYNEGAETDDAPVTNNVLLYVQSMLLLSWTVDAVLYAASQSTIHWPVLDTVFEDLYQMSNETYVLACGLYDMFGAPEDDEDDDDVGEWIEAECA